MASRRPSLTPTRCTPARSRCSSRPRSGLIRATTPTPAAPPPSAPNPLYAFATNFSAPLDSDVSTWNVGNSLTIALASEAAPFAQPFFFAFSNLSDSAAVSERALFTLPAAASGSSLILLYLCRGNGTCAFRANIAWGCLGLEPAPNSTAASSISAGSSAATGLSALSSTGGDDGKDSDGLSALAVGLVVAVVLASVVVLAVGYLLYKRRREQASGSEALVGGGRAGRDGRRAQLLSDDSAA